jgi:hypothetical protein
VLEQYLESGDDGLLSNPFILIIHHSGVEIASLNNLGVSQLLSAAYRHDN